METISMPTMNQGNAKQGQITSALDGLTSIIEKAHRDMDLLTQKVNPIMRQNDSIPEKHLEPATQLDLDVPLVGYIAKCRQEVESLSLRIQQLTSKIEL